MTRPITIPGSTAPAEGTAIRVMVEGVAVAVFNVGGALYGIEAKCTHVGGPLEKGRVESGVVTCPWHGSQFDIKTGQVRRGPAASPVRAHAVRASPQGLIVDLP